MRSVCWDCGSASRQRSTTPTTRATCAPPPDQWRPRWGDLRYVALGVACQLAVDVLYAPFHLKSLDKPVHHLFNASHGVSFVLIAIMTTLLAPFFEEWLFRGVIYRSIAEGATGVSPGPRSRWVCS